MAEFTVTEREATRLARQAPLDLTLPTRGVAVIGCGGVGSWLALFLAFAGVRNLWLWDHDTLSDHNLNRLPATPDWVGKSKAEAVAATIVKFRPDCKPVAMGRFDSDTANTINLHHECNWIVATTDTWTSRKAVADWAIDQDVFYIEAAAEGEYGSIAGLPADFATDAESQPGYASVPVWVGPCVAAAMMAVAHIIHGVPPDSDLAIRTGWDRDAYHISFQSPRNQYFIIQRYNSDTDDYERCIDEHLDVEFISREFADDAIAEYGDGDAEYRVRPAQPNITVQPPQPLTRTNEPPF